MMSNREYKNWVSGIIASKCTADWAEETSDNLPDPEARRLMREHWAKFRELVTYLESRVER